MPVIPWELVGAHAGAIAGTLILWGLLGGVAGLAIAIGMSAVLAKTGALGVSFRFAGAARAIVHVWIAVVGLAAGGTIGAVHGGSRGLQGIVRSPVLAGAALRPAAAPVAAGLAYTVALQTNVDPTPFVTGTAPIPCGPLRAALGDPTGAAVVAGMRRVPQLQPVAGSSTGGAIVGLLAETLAGDHATSVLEAAGLFDSMEAMGARLPPDAIFVGALAAEVERTMLPAFVATWIGRIESQILASVAIPALLAIAGAVALLWAIEAIVRAVRRSRAASAANAVDPDRGG